MPSIRVIDVGMAFRRTGEAEGGVEFIDGAEGFDAEGGFRDALGEHQIRFPGIAAAGDNAHAESLAAEKFNVHPRSSVFALWRP